MKFDFITKIKTQHGLCDFAYVIAIDRTHFSTCLNILCKLSFVYIF